MKTINIQNHIDKGLILMMAVLFMMLSIVISYFGNPISDESLVFAIALRFLNGQKPFVDDYSPFMSLGLLLMPFVKLSLLLHHGKGELILFMRHFFIAFQFCVTTYAFFVMKKYLSPTLAFLCAAIIFMYHSFGINTFHYDTLCTSLWSVLAFLSIDFVINKQSFRSFLIFSSLSMILCFAYPTFSLYVVLFFLLVYFSINERKKFLLSNVIVFSCAISILMVTIFYYFGLHINEIMNGAHASKSIVNIYAHHSLINKCIGVLSILVTQYYRYLLITFGCLMIGKYFLKNKWSLFLLLGGLLIFPLLQIDTKLITFLEIFSYFNAIGFLSALLFIVFLRKNKLAKLMFCYIWLPSLFAGILTSSTSSNGIMNFNVGFFPAAILAFVYSYFILQSEFTHQNILTNNVYTRLLVLYGLLITAFFQTIFIYASPMSLSEYSQAKKYNISGPFHGIYLNPYWSNYYEAMQNVVKKIDLDKKYVYFGPMSGGYLLVDKLIPAEYLLYCPYDLNHYFLPLKMPSYIYFDLAFTTGINNEPYISKKIYKKTNESPYYELYYGEKS